MFDGTPDLLGILVDSLPFIAGGAVASVVAVAQIARYKRFRAYGPGGGRK